MVSEAIFSDEPTRLSNTIAKLFSGQADGTSAVTVSESSRVDLIAGADAQDDCAVFRFAGEQELVVGSDYVRGPKFRLYEMGVLDEYDLGYYLVAANVSDVAAMGAVPIGLLSVVRYPHDMADFVFDQVMEGIRDACDEFGCPNVGGDIGGAERLILSASALGVCKPGGALLRGGAKAGDVVCLTGPTGLAGAAMEYLRSRSHDDRVDSVHLPALLRSWKRPQARVKQGALLGRSGVVTSCQDTSDGLKATLETIARSSDVGITVIERDLPMSPEVTAVCDHLGSSDLSVVMGDSVDFELVFTVPRSEVDRLRIEFTSFGLDFHSIGLVTEERTTVLERTNGSRIPLPGKVWRHTPDVALAPGGAPE